MPGLRLLGDSRPELGPHRQVADGWHATGRQPAGAKLQGDAMPSLHLRKNFMDK